MACQIRNRKPFQKQTKEYGELQDLNVRGVSTVIPLGVKAGCCSPVEIRKVHSPGHHTTVLKALARERERAVNIYTD